MVWVNLKENPSHVELQSIAVPAETNSNDDEAQIQ